MNPIRKGSLGVIQISTQWDDPADFVKRNAEIQETVAADYCIIPINGDEIPDLSTCLNLGIQAAIEARVEYVTWCHGDFIYSDPNWFTGLKAVLERFPQILKICASNSRDEIHPFRIGQEQSWLLRAKDMLKYPWLWFDQRYIRCGGVEDYSQHLNILARGYLVCITPDVAVYHKGAQTRGKYSTDLHQLQNQHMFGQLTGFGGLVEVHDPKYLGCALSDEEFAFILGSLTRPELEAIRQDVLKTQRHQVNDPTRFLNAIFPQSPQAQAVLQAQRTSYRDKQEGSG